MQILNRSFYVTFLFVFLMDLVVNCSKCKPKTSFEQWLCVVSSLTARYYFMTEIFSVVFQVLFCFFQALFGEKQKEEEIEKLKNEMSQLAEDTAARIRKAVSYDIQKESTVNLCQI